MRRYRRWYRANVRLCAFTPVPLDHRIRRVAYHHCAAQPRAHVALRRAAVPLVITRAIDAWPAMSKLCVRVWVWFFGANVRTKTWHAVCLIAEWSGEQLAARFADVEWEISHTATDGLVTMTMADYMSYMQQQHDEEPLYIFDAR